MMVPSAVSFIAWTWNRVNGNVSTDSTAVKTLCKMTYVAQPQPRIDVSHMNSQALSFSRLAEKYKSARVELELLYGSIFDGYTPAYPEEDQAEGEVRAIQSIQTRVSANLSIEYSIIDLLRSASKAMTSCQEKMREALYWSSACKFYYFPALQVSQAFAVILAKSP